jgi:hypothetical protein
MTLAINENTRRTYSTAIRSYAFFCHGRGWPMHPITTPHAAQWIAHIGTEAKLASGTLTAYRSALSTCHREFSMGQGANP